MVFSTDFEPPMATWNAGSEKPLGLFCFGCFRLGNTVMKHNGARKTHEFNCMENPKRRKLDQCKETKVTTENPDVKIYFQSAQPNVKVDEPTKKIL